MRRIYAKTGTRRQAELVRLLTTGQAPSDPAER
jgi:DNA-binding CsgD family transcriptional regulator